VKKPADRKLIAPLLIGCAFFLGSSHTGHAAIQQSHVYVQAENHIAQTTISEEQAKSIALQQVKGRIVHVELDTDNGVTKYEVIIITDQNEVYEVEINAANGQVLKVEKENN
jgi:uncharacterized membrane protein YkoI